MRCKNSGSGYDASSVEWTCSAALPPEFKLGSTDVICEGYDGPDDEYVLKGSCGVEYRLSLTELGEEKYGKVGSGGWGSSFKGVGDGVRGSRLASWLAELVGVVFWVLFLAALWVIISGFLQRFRGRSGPGRPGFGFGGGSGGGGGGDDDPPPPYDWRPPRKTYGTYGGGSQGWSPGFWSGALGGAAAGYLAGNRQNRYNQGSNWLNGGYGGGGGGFGGRSGLGGWNRGEGSSSGGSRSSSGYSSSRYQSTGFGSTSRR